MTLSVSDLQSDSDLDSIRNSCDDLEEIFNLNSMRQNIILFLLSRIFMRKTCCSDISANNKYDGFSTLSLYIYVLKRSFSLFKFSISFRLIFQCFLHTVLMSSALLMFLLILGLYIIIIGLCVCAFVFVLFLQNDRCLSLTLPSAAFLIHSLQKHHTTATGSLPVLFKHTR